MRKKYDCITFLNGFEILKLRLAELAGHIDYFVIVEETHSFQGKPKPLYFKESPITGYPIIHVVHETRHQGDLTSRFELAVNNINGAVEEGFREGLKDSDATDIGYFSDFDEIMRPSKLLAGPLDVPVLFEMELFVYWLNSGTGQKGPMTTRIMLGAKDQSYWSALQYRYAARNDKIIIPDAGWHFTSFGGLDTVMEKFAGYPDSPVPSHLSREKVDDYMLGGIDFSDNSMTKRPIGPLPADLPETILKDPKAWTHLMHPDWRS